MFDEAFSDLFAPALVALVTAMVTSIGTISVERRRHGRDFATRAAETIRAERLDAYRGLWRTLEPMSLDWTTTRDLEAVHGELRSWYYQEGGMLLSARALRHFWALQGLLRAGSTHEQAYPRFVELAKAIRDDLWTESVPPAPGIGPNESGARAGSTDS